MVGVAFRRKVNFRPMVGVAFRRKVNFRPMVGVAFRRKVNLWSVAFKNQVESKAVLIIVFCLFL